MPENFEGSEKPRNFSEEEVLKIQDLADKVYEVIEWDLEKTCGTKEESDLVSKAQDAMKEIATMFNMPTGHSWEDKEPKPTMSKTFSLDDIKKLRLNLKAIEKVIEWDLSANDEEELTMIREARESLEKLKSIL